MSETELVTIERETSLTRLGRRLRFFAVLFLGMVLGILLAIVTIILPRKNELALVHQESPFFTAFNPTAELERLTGKPPEQVQTDEDRDAMHGRSWTRTHIVRCKVPAAEQVATFDKLLGAFQSSVFANTGPASRRRMRQQIWTSSRGTQTGDKWTYQYASMHYHEGRTAGVVNVTATGRGDELTFHVSVSER
jgi:hypothetical protein